MHKQDNMKLNLENFGTLFDILLFVMPFVGFAFIVAGYLKLFLLMTVCKFIFVGWLVYVVCFMFATMIHDVKTGKGDMW